MSARTVISITIVAVAVWASPAGAQTPPWQQPRPEPATEHVTVGGDVVRLFDDTGAYLTAPLHWDSGARLRAGAFVVVLGGLIAADRRINQDVRDDRGAGNDRLASGTQNLGQTGALGLSVAALGIGLLSRNEELRDTGRDALEASVISGALTNLVLKHVAGRERPRESGGLTRFHPFTGSDASFPSGHATEAFTVATVFAAHSHGWVVPTIAYSLASLVAFDRMEQNAHFASDVFTGAVIGITTARFIVRRHATEAASDPALPRTHQVAVAPLFARKGAGVEFTIEF